jgi:hypothetical protein
VPTNAAVNAAAVAVDTGIRAVSEPMIRIDSPSAMMMNR